MSQGTPTDWAADAAARLAKLGFLDVHGDTPDAPGGSRLLVALRSQPTISHFDPEAIGYWSLTADRGRPARFSREDPRPADVPVSWGRLKVVDRIPVENQFVTFGGRLRARDVDPETTIVEFSSPAPILRWSGHSQGVDPLTDDVGAFFARLMIPIDFVPGAEARIGRLGPLALYGAMLAAAHDRMARSRSLRETEQVFEQFVTHEVTRLTRVHPDELEAGRRLLVDLGLGPGGPFGT